MDMVKKKFHNNHSEAMRKKKLWTERAFISAPIKTGSMVY